MQFDFLVHDENKGYYEDEVLELGAKIYRLPKFEFKNIFKYFNKVNDFFKNHNEYKIVHGHILSTAPIYMRAAKKYNVPIRIAHSRSGTRNNINFENAIKEIFKRMTRFYITNKLAVSKVAAISAFGKRAVKNDEVKIIPNAIDTDKYIFNNNIREKKRKELDLEGKFVVGHIGRFSQEKNHEFIIDVFLKILEHRSNSVLVLVGDGELREKMMKKVSMNNINNKVIFTGIRSDVPEILQAFDVLLFPSLFEGLPGVVLESQAAGLPCLISKNITNEVRLTNLVKYIPLDKNTEYWAKKTIEFGINTVRSNKFDEIAEAGFDIKSVSKTYQDFYINNLNKL